MAESMKSRKRKWILAALLCWILALPAAAAETGRLHLTVENVPELEVCLHYVAAVDGVLTEAFSPVQVKPESLLDEKETENNAKLLYIYAVEQEIAGVCLTTDEAGYACFENLETGCYLVCCAGETAEFEPFLVCIPMTINGATIFEIQAAPKSGEDDPEAVTPTEPLEPEADIPYTGTNVWPQYLLLALGVLTAGWGMAELLRGRKEAHE